MDRRKTARSTSLCLSVDRGVKGQPPLCKMLSLTLTFCVLNFSNYLRREDLFLLIDLSCSLAKGSVKSLSNLVDELEGVEPLVTRRLVSAMHADGKILCHEASLDSANDLSFHSLAERLQLIVVVKLGTVEKTTSPCEHGSDRVRGGLTALLVHTVVSCDSSVGSLSLDGAISGLEHGGHQTEGAVALSDDIRLDITVVVLAGPDEATAGLDGIGDHIVDETVLVPETSGLELLLVVGLVDLLEDVLEATVVSLEDSVLGGQVAGVVASESVLHARVGEASDGLVSVVHAHEDTSALEVEHLELGGVASVSRGEGHGELAGSLGAEIGGSVLITEGVSANNDGLGPAWHESGDVLDDDGLTEDGSTDDVSDGAVGGSPHLLEVELLDASLIRGDGSALDADLAGLDSLSSLDGDLIVSGVTVLDAQIEVLDVQVQVRSNQLILDELPDDSGHLVTIELNNGLGNSDLGGCGFSHLD